jgi:hypothetical protein
MNTVIAAILAAAGAQALPMQDGENRHHIPGSPGSPKPTAPGQVQPPITPPPAPTPGASDVVELRGEVVSLPEYFGTSASPAAPTPKPGSPATTSPSTKEGPWGILVRNDARSGNRDQLYLMLAAPGDRDTRDHRNTQETVVRGRLMERAGVKVIMMSAPGTPRPGDDLRQPDRAPAPPATTPDSTPPK